jgi:hypothetical protein
LMVMQSGGTQIPAERLVCRTILKSTIQALRSFYPAGVASTLFLTDRSASVLLKIEYPRKKSMSISS